MTGYEYKVIPAPAKGRKAQGAKGPEARFAATLESVLNAQAAEGWEYLRSDILPSEERQRLTSTQTVYRTLLVFRRARSTTHDAASEVISDAQTVAEAATSDETAPQRREPTITPTRGDPATPPETPETPETPQDDPRPDTPGPDTPKRN